MSSIPKDSAKDPQESSIGSSRPVFRYNRPARKVNRSDIVNSILSDGIPVDYTAPPTIGKFANLWPDFAVADNDHRSQLVSDTYLTHAKLSMMNKLLPGVRIVYDTHTSKTGCHPGARLERAYLHRRYGGSAEPTINVGGNPLRSIHIGNRYEFSLVPYRDTMDNIRNTRFRRPVFDSLCRSRPFCINTEDDIDPAGGRFDTDHRKWRNYCHHQLSDLINGTCDCYVTEDQSLDNYHEDLEAKSLPEQSVVDYDTYVDQYGQNVTTYILDDGKRQNVVKTRHVGAVLPVGTRVNVIKVLRGESYVSPLLNLHRKYTNCNFPDTDVPRMLFNHSAYEIDPEDIASAMHTCNTQMSHVILHKYVVQKIDKTCFFRRVNGQDVEIECPATDDRIIAMGLQHTIPNWGIGRVNNPLRGIRWNCRCHGDWKMCLAYRIMANPELFGLEVNYLFGDELPYFCVDMGEFHFLIQMSADDVPYVQLIYKDHYKRGSFSWNDNAGNTFWVAKTVVYENDYTVVFRWTIDYQEILSESFYPKYAIHEKAATDAQYLEERLRGMCLLKKNEIERRALIAQFAVTIVRNEQLNVSNDEVADIVNKVTRIDAKAAYTARTNDVKDRPLHAFLGGISTAQFKDTMSAYLVTLGHTARGSYDVFNHFIVEHQDYAFDTWLRLNMYANWILLLVLQFIHIWTGAYYDCPSFIGILRKILALMEPFTFCVILYGFFHIMHELMYVELPMILVIAGTLYTLFGVGAWTVATFVFTSLGKRVSAGEQEHAITQSIPIIYILIALLISYCLRRVIRKSVKRPPMVVQVGVINAFLGLKYKNFIGVPKMIPGVARAIKSSLYRYEDPRVVMRNHGPTLLGYTPVCLDTRDWDNQLSTLQHRVFKERPKYVDRTGKAFVAWVRDNIETLFPVERVLPMTRATWLQRFKGEKRRIIEEAYQDFVYYGNPLDTTFLDQLEINDFVKLEPLIQNEFKSGRNIGARTPIYNLLWGNATKTAGKIFAELSKPETNPYFVYASGLNRRQVGALFDDFVADTKYFGEPVAFVSDFSSYDMTVNKYLIAAEALFYRHLMFLDVFHDCVIDQLQYTIRGKTKYHRFDLTKCHGYTMLVSGNVNTSIGNSFRTGAMRLYQYWRAVGRLPSLAEPFRIMVLGDDSLTITTRKIADTVAKDDSLVELGMKVKQSVEDLDHAEFCSSRYAPTSVGTILLPKPFRVLGKTFYNVHNLGRDKVRGYARGIAQGFQYDYFDFPIMRVLMRHIVRVTDGVKVWRHPDAAARQLHEFNHCDQSWKATSETYRWFYNVYGVTRDDIELLEKQLKAELPDDVVFKLVHPLFAHMFFVDNGFRFEDVDPQLAMLQLDSCVSDRYGSS